MLTSTSLELADWVEAVAEDICLEEKRPKIDFNNDLFHRCILEYE
jgi:hypothetical protein